MNKKGFTTIELIASFSIAMVILIVLFNVVLIMKDSYQNLDGETELLVQKDNLSYTINKKLRDKNLIQLTTCTDATNCYLFTYNDSTFDKLIYDKDKKVITFDNYTFEISDSITVNDIKINEYYDDTTSTLYNGYFIINIPLEYNNKDYSIKIIHQFNTDALVIII